MTENAPAGGCCLPSCVSSQGMLMATLLHRTRHSSYSQCCWSTYDSQTSWAAQQHQYLTGSLQQAEPAGARHWPNRSCPVMELQAHPVVWHLQQQT